MLNFGSKKKNEAIITLPAKVEERTIPIKERLDTLLKAKDMITSTPSESNEPEIIALPEELKDCSVEHLPANERYYPKHNGYYLMEKDGIYVLSAQENAVWCHSAAKAIEVLVRAMEFFGRGVKDIPVTQELYNEYLKQRKTWNSYRRL